MVRVFIQEVDGKSKEVELDPAQLKVKGNVNGQAVRVAEMIGIVGELIADTTEDLGTTKAAYRAWRAKQITRVLKHEPKTPDWKSRAAYESMPAFIEHKQAIAQCEGDLEFLRIYLEGLKMKGEMVRVRADYDLTKAAHS